MIDCPLNTSHKLTPCSPACDVSDFFSKSVFKKEPKEPKEPKKTVMIFFALASTAYPLPPLDWVAGGQAPTSDDSTDSTTSPSSTATVAFPRAIGLEEEYEKAIDTAYNWWRSSKEDTDHAEDLLARAIRFHETILNKIYYAWYLIQDMKHYAVVSLQNATTVLISANKTVGLIDNYDDESTYTSSYTYTYTYNAVYAAADENTYDLASRNGISVGFI